jgi:pilus assembly protein CpaC
LHDIGNSLNFGVLRLDAGGLMRSFPLVTLCGLLFPVVLAGPVGAQPASSSVGAAGQGGIEIRDVTHLVPPIGRPILIEVSKGTLVSLSEPAGTVFVADPNIADVQVKSPKLIYITAKSPGETVIYAVDANDHVLLNAPIRVSLDISSLRRSLQRLIPDTLVAADSVGRDLVLTGTVASAGQAEKAVALATAVADEVKGKVVNRMSVATPNQVDLRVLIAEVDRSVLKEIGVDWSKLAGEVTFSTGNIPRPIVNTLTLGQAIGNATTATISALETEGFLTVLAQPDLVAVSGQTANFLAGGEFPVPVAQSGATGSTGAITVQFQPFGVQLAFTPTVIDSDHLSLKVAPSVSQLSTQGEVTICRGCSPIPALTVRSAETTVDLASGQSFALAGLLQHTTEQDISKVPWIGNIPILGALFRSNKFQNNESELVILVTPYLVRPSTQPLSNPVAGYQSPNDLQQVFMSDTYRQKLPGPAQGPLSPGGTGLIGPGGFQLN